MYKHHPEQRAGKKSSLPGRLLVAAAVTAASVVVTAASASIAAKQAGAAASAAVAAGIAASAAISAEAGEQQENPDPVARSIIVVCADAVASARVIAATVSSS